MKDFEISSKLTDSHVRWLDNFDERTGYIRTVKKGWFGKTTCIIECDSGFIVKKDLDTLLFSSRKKSIYKKDYKHSNLQFYGSNKKSKDGWAIYQPTKGISAATPIGFIKDKDCMEFIVKACNLHYKLVEVLKSLKFFLMKPYHWILKDDKYYCAMLDYSNVLSQADEE